ncbi:ABC transporter permease [Beijerinckia indica]|uniref:Binding-protein-dependent transport systems inner membrane component n=1 Tax=Beijerinckia indica subsp. indica (strain ATCC 9039 / DSM 1715 / NCIMB 8712) TaxID=395963 RepID=B2IIT8_BEII9|nr:ABC transporter permease [Beijerinckia indica]ACB96150.1 binding-protein-dependent transport systems inner membrane component [Beijerinckia indica subsp. indica ATCC 9039]
MSGSPRVLKVLWRTALHAVPTGVGIVILTFFLLRLAPGDAADVLAAESGSATQETMDALRNHFGLDLPVFDQLLAYLGNLSHFSLGVSPRYNMPVAELIGQRLPSTLILIAVSMALSLALGIAAGVIMAVFAGTWLDRLLSVIVLLFYSIPGFWIGLMLIVLFSVKLGWLPSGGGETIASGLTGLPLLKDRLAHMVLPTLSLAFFYIAIYARLTRGAMLDVLGQDYVRTARAKGLSPYAVVVRHVLRNALLPVTTLAGVYLGSLIGGTVVVETIYSWPGLGRLAYEAVMGRDFTVLLGILLLSSFFVVSVNALVDLLQAWLDPRIEAL